MPLMEEIRESRNNDLHSLKLNHDREEEYSTFQKPTVSELARIHDNTKQYGLFNLHVSKGISLILNFHIGMMILSSTKGMTLSNSINSER